MNKRPPFPLLVVIIASIILCLSLLLLPRIPEFERTLLERLANRYTQESFAGSVRIDKVSLDRHFKIRLTGITAKLQTRQGAIPLEIGSFESQDPLFLVINSKPVRFIFEGVRPKGSPRAGISGNLSVQMRPVFHATLFADFGKTDLADWQWLDPQNLGGATGAMKGSLTFGQTAGQEPEFNMALEAPQPGGNIQARFFDLFLPYLPASLQKEKVRKVSESRQVVRYDQAALTVNLLQSDRIKIILRIFIPDYNLKLTLNADIRTDSKDAFSQIARIMGLIEVR